MSQYNRNKPIDKRMLEVENHVDRVLRELDQLRRMRFPQADLHRDIRWAITDGIVPSTYPNADANTFPIIFCDAYFTKSAGLRTFVNQLRTADPVTFAHAETGQYIPAELPLPVFWQRGLGGEGKGEWWFLDPPRLYVVELTTPLNYRGSASAEIHLPDALYELSPSGVIITVHDVALTPGETRGIGTRLLAEWYLTPFPHWIVAPPPIGLAIATLQYDMCGNTATIVDFKKLDGTDTPAPAPTTADNTLFKHRGLAGDKVLLTWGSIDDGATWKWRVIDVTKHEYDVYVGMRRTGDCEDFGCIEADVIRANLEICSTHVSRVVFCLPPCNDTSVQSSITQTSFTQTSIAQSSTIGCHGSEINPDIVNGTPDDLTVRIRLHNGTFQRLVSVTVTQAEMPCPMDPSQVSPGQSTDSNIQSPRSNDVQGLGVGYDAILLLTTSRDAEGNIGSYGQGWYEEYQISCRQREDILADEGATISSDPTDVEWRIDGSWGNVTLGLGYGLDGESRITETQGAAFRSIWTGGNEWTPTGGGLQVLSLNPFHAIANFTPCPRYPFWPVIGTCGPITIEFMEL